ncbi:Metal-dependent hydrolase of the beta-lactamase superfamily I [Pediococcus damnosus]|uniref:Metal-dependent hydrolase of the beta-lactamase superfamily I n=1 Tax=Pediococcus damnosus TaxID=51663 RepID=A0A0R2GVJ5_9LACO|nr:MBL fold metallo-hydrolase [Pediococcus damnosus]AMV59874.1 Metal-dependent hydrolases of the beta-lactamase superfamily I [Pediococcus damnosus]AMV61834.1 Metal-dependent hydrolase of the beta-lactamase superfamily I [Pediococcus damnosus]AMV64120.1 Metal-dependent hydrolase of the beta-lactamase superfamily I [Pediococcus damnosus]AMV66293.1 Metal-dependent hydrolase of the beta-lactamase superfamily I [Pediococcus damnosus]AMV68569.1 Metal-dependent hydrolase of the beta-lactamase superf
MKLTVLGYYGGYPWNDVGTSAYLIQSGDYNLLLDCGSEALLTLEEVLDPLQLDAVLLSHYHHDHTADVGVLQYFWQLRDGNKREPVLPIYGHTQDPLNFGALTWPESTVGKAYTDDQTLNLGPLQLTFMKTHHPVPAFAVRIVERSSQKVLVFTSDTAYFSELAKFAHNADFLMTDTNFYANKTGKKWHMTSTESGKLANQAHAKRLLLTHLPQTGNLEQLKQEAQDSAGTGVQVERAHKLREYQV